MVSIIRSPAISEERRKLKSRRTIASEAVSAAVAAADAPALNAPIAPVAPVAPVAAPLAAPPVVAPVPPPVAAPASPPAPPVPDMNALIAQARESVLAQFKDDADKARELGRQRGLQEGRQSGAEEAKKTFEAELARVRSIADQLQQATATGFKGLEEMAVAIAFEAVCKMMGSAAVTREGIQALVSEAAAHAVSSEKVVVRLHPGDLSALRGAGALDEALPSGTLVTWSADKNVVLGGCIVETESGELDARLETQLDRLRAALVAARGLPQ
ncbi:hypothetical protein HF313_22310 [Massilia atriviolacea]|uniref:Flagellar assembly protein FliH n=1 Tax=Massilia atriviolacea TaxID=2495579 RepID=A0A430HFW1_9BURK|nr:FliH/SctL family protein [Massilia atriviolacea]RSZ56382.1 hypothetical protein EJB06_25010 [Massilia atriviolacea]